MVGISIIPVIVVIVAAAAVGDTIAHDHESGRILGRPSFDGTDEIPESPHVSHKSGSTMDRRTSAQLSGSTLSNRVHRRGYQTRTTK